MKDDVAQLQEVCDQEDPSPRQILDRLRDVERALGRLHGILGKLPITFVPMPDDVYVPYTQAMVTAERWLMDREGWIAERTEWRAKKREGS